MKTVNLAPAEVGNQQDPVPATRAGVSAGVSECDFDYRSVQLMRELAESFRGSIKVCRGSAVTLSGDQLRFAASLLLVAASVIAEARGWE